MMGDKAHFSFRLYINTQRRLVGLSNKLTVSKKNDDEIYYSFCNIVCLNNRL